MRRWGPRRGRRDAEGSVRGRRSRAPPRESVEGRSFEIEVLKMVQPFLRTRSSQPLRELHCGRIHFLGVSVEGDRSSTADRSHFKKREEWGRLRGAEGPACPRPARAVKCVRKPYPENSHMHMKNHAVKRGPGIRTRYTYPSLAHSVDKFGVSESLPPTPWLPRG